MTFEDKFQIMKNLHIILTEKDIKKKIDLKK